MGFFNLNNVQSESANLLPGIRKVFFNGAKKKENNGQIILDFSFKGRDGDEGFYNASFFESTFDPDHQYNSSLSEEDFGKKVQRELGKIKTLVKSFARISEFPDVDSFEELAEFIADLFNVEDTDAEWRSIEAELKLVYNQSDKVVLPLFGFINTPLNQRKLKIDPDNKYDRITPLEAINTDSAFNSLADDEEGEDEDLM